jgi:hypothetical protein
MLGLMQGGTVSFYRSKGSVWPMLGSTSHKDLIWVKPTALGITLH